MQLTKTYRILEFTQSAWLKPYVEHCTANRQKARSDFEKDLWKLWVNAVYGKSMENIRNRINVRLVCDPAKVKKIVAKPTFRQCRIINDDLVMIESAKRQLVLNKPIYTGFSILDISKTVMYEFHYHHIVPRYGNKAKLLFTDTDSLCYDIETDDLYKDMEMDKGVYDTSNFESDHTLFSEQNKKVLGKFKSETGSRAPTEFVGLKAKMYSLEISKREKAKMTAKGIKRGYVSKHVRHQQFLNTLKTKLQTYAKFKQFGTKNHVIKTLNINKICLNAYDDKRYLLDDGIRSLAYGHWRIKDYRA